MRALIDTDVLLDVALARKPHLAQSERVLRWAEKEGSAGVAWHSLTNCAYLLKSAGRAYLVRVVQIMTVACGSTADARRALSLPMPDLEDAFQAAAAIAWKADCIVTRNVRDYRNSPVPAFTPAAFLQHLS